MIEIGIGDLLQANVDALVNTVNCVGAGGKGIALQFKNKFPQNFAAYKRACRLGKVIPGQMFIVELNQLFQPRYIINFPTKRHWKDNSLIEDIISGLQSLVREINLLQIRSIAIPPLGCGNGHLNWDDVRPLIESAFHKSEVHVLLFEPKI